MNMSVCIPKNMIVMCVYVYEYMCMYMSTTISNYSSLNDNCHHRLI